MRSQLFGFLRILAIRVAFEANSMGARPKQTAASATAIGIIDLDLVFIILSPVSMLLLNLVV